MILVGFLPRFSLAGTCVSHLTLPGNIPAVIDTHGITVGGFAAVMYPLQDIKENLSLSDQNVALLEDKSVLLIGEGFSPLLPYLLSKGVNARAIDPIYGAEKSLGNQSFSQEYRRYIEQNRTHLVAESGDSYLRKIPSSSIQAVFSHLAISNIFDYQTRYAIFTEVGRVLGCGGHARFAWYGFKPSEVGWRVILDRAFEQDRGIHFLLSDNGVSDLLRSPDFLEDLSPNRVAQPDEWILRDRVRIQFLDIWRDRCQ